MTQELHRSVKDLTPVVVEKRKTASRKIDMESNINNSDKMSLKDSILCQTTNCPEENAPLNVKYGENLNII